MNSTEARQWALQEWLAAALPAPFALQPMTPGAGLRRYWRVTGPDQRFVVMDAPAGEKCATFIQLAQAFQALGVAVPAVHAADVAQGFLLLTDFGDDLYGNILTTENVDGLYQQAFTTLLRIQSFPQTASVLQPFDMVHYREKMGWFSEFYLRRYLNFPLTQSQRSVCERLFDVLIEQALQQPTACVHYDYHCRNLMRLPNGETGVLDFQDAVRGPVTYDLMSLLRDCYVEWPALRVRAWLQQYQQLALQAGVLSQEDPVLWERWCDFSSAQTHIKNIGLFARFHVLGRSSHYLVYISRLLQYLRGITARYAEMAPFKELLEKMPQ